MCFRVYPARSCPWCVPRWVCRNGGFVKSDEQPQLRLIISHSIEMGYFAFEPLRYIDFLWFSESCNVWLNFQSSISSDLFECFCMKLRSHGCMSLSSVKPCETARAFGGHPRHPCTEDETLDIGDSLPPYASEVTVKGLTFCLRVCKCSCYKDLFFFLARKTKSLMQRQQKKLL